MTRRISLALGALLLAGLVGGAGGVFAAFSSTAASQANSFTAASDWVAPVSATSAIGKSTGGVTGYIRPGGSYFVYAQVSDGGNPASGVASVTANTSTFDTGVTAAALASGSFSAGGLSYNRRSGTLTANTSLPAGSYTYTVRSTDAAGNAHTQTYGVTVDATAPTASDVQTSNGGSIAGRPEQNDVIRYTFSERAEPNSLLAEWTGGAIDCVVRVNNGATGANDTLTVFNSANSTQVRLGTVNLGRSDYVGASRTFGLTGTKSRMSQDGSEVTIVFGTQSGAGTTAASTGTMTWTPVATATDLAGNAMSTTARTESGGADAEF